MRAVLAVLCLLILAPSAHASGWSTPRVFAAGSEPTPRAAITETGNAVAAWRTASGSVVAVLRDGQSGRFSRPQTVARRPHSFAVAMNGAGTAIAWEASDGLHVSVLVGNRFRDVLRIPSTGSEINGVTIAADPQGGFAVAERQFPRRGSGAPYRVRAFSLDPGGRLTGPVQDLGLGQFGLDARQTQALVVLPDGRAVLSFRREAERLEDPPPPVVVTTRPRGGVFGEPVVVGTGLSDPRLTVAGDRATLTVVAGASCGDAGCSGLPRASVIGEDGVPGPLTGPELPNPRRAFAPWAVGSTLVFALKTGVQPFSREAPVRASSSGGPLQTLTAERASEPVALSLESGKVLALWVTRKAFGAALAPSSGRFHRVRAPAGPPPSPYHYNATNRDARALGTRVIVAWARGKRVRVSTRAF